MANYFNPNKKEISGPTNVVRMEGKIHGIKKVIYLFFDWHVPMYAQSECDNIFAKDIEKYLVENFYELSKKSSTTYDFFLEIRPTEELLGKQDERLEQKNKYKGIYIEQVMKLFRKIFKYDKEKNKVDIPEIFANIRVHFLDIRDYLKNHFFYKLLRVRRIAFESFMYLDIHTEALKYMIDQYEIVAKHLEFMITAMSTTKFEKTINKQIIIKPKELEGVDEQMIMNLMDKIRNGYKDDNIKKIMNTKLDSLVEKLNELLKEIRDAVDVFKKYGSIPPNIKQMLTKDERYHDIYTYGLSPYVLKDIVVDISNICDTIFFKTMFLFAELTDIYFLRRFLDKDYITNGIVYSGGAHSENYVYILVNDFGFDITHVAYSSSKNIDELTKDIKNLPIKELTRIFSPPILNQCSDISHFPDNFL